MLLRVFKKSLQAPSSAPVRPQQLRKRTRFAGSHSEPLATKAPYIAAQGELFEKGKNFTVRVFLQWPAWLEQSSQCFAHKRHSHSRQFEVSDTIRYSLSTREGNYLSLWPKIAKFSKISVQNLQENAVVLSPQHQGLRT